MEMNLHMSQDLESESELLNLAAVPYQIISPANNTSIIGIYQDSMLGSYLFSRENIKFTPRQAMNLLMMYNNVNENELLKIINNEGKVSNFDILTQILPPLSLKYKTKLFKDKDDYQTSNNVLEIRNGKYIRGQMDKGVLGGGTKGILQRICNDFGNFASSKFIDDLQNIVTEYMKTSGFSVGISDLISNQNTNEEIIKIITNKKTEVKNLIDQVQMGLFENNTGKTNQEEFETRINSILNQATSEAGKIGLKNLSQGNRFVTMVQAGSKGSDLNISFMISCLGQQNVDGKRIPYGFEHRTLPHFTKYDDTPGARGFVESSYINGLTPQELFMHAMGGRIGLIDTACKTSTTGYIQRRLIKGLEDLKIEYDMTIRTNKNKIVQFQYGDDSIDTTKVENQELPIVEMNIQDIYNHYLIPDETSNTKILGNIFIKNVLTRYKKQKNEYTEKINNFIENIIKQREIIIKNVFKNKSDKIINCPVAFSYIINNIQGQCGISSSSLVDITPLEAFEIIQNYFNNLKKLFYSPPTELFEILYYYYLSPKELCVIKRFNKSSLILLLDTITNDFKRSIITPGEMVGMIAAQSIGEVSTQMSVPYETQHKILIVNKNTGEINCKSIIVGEFCDYIIKNNPDLTFNTGHFNSYETILEPLQEEYYIQSVSEYEKTKWTKLSHISRHPVNGKMMRIYTRSGRQVESTPSHSHLIRLNHKIQPIMGSDMKEGMRIPVCKNIIIPNELIQNYIKLNDGTNILLDEKFGWFIGTYLSIGKLKFNEICITNVSDIYIHKLQEIALQFNKITHVYKKQCEYRPSIIIELKYSLAKLLFTKCADCNYLKKIPDFAFNAPIEFKKGLFQGYFDGNGKIKSDANYYQIKCTSRNKQLIKDLSLILNSFNIFSSIKTENKKDNKLYLLNIPLKYSKLYYDNIGTLLYNDKLCDIIRFIERYDKSYLSEKIDKIDGFGEIIAYCCKTLKIQEQSRIYGYLKNKQSIDRTTLEKYYNIFKNTNDNKLIENELKLMEQVITSDIIWDEITHIEYYTPEQNNYVYDFTVPGYETFMTDYGIFVHNTLNSVVYETPIIVRSREGKISKYNIGDFIENNIKLATKIEYYKDKDTTYAELDNYYDIQSCDEDGNILWKRIEAVTRHPVINKDGSNTMLKITTDEEREVIATKAKSFLKLVDGKIIPVNGDELKVGDYLPVSIKDIDFTENYLLNLREILQPNEYIYSSEIEKAQNVMNESRWWSKHQNKTFTLPYKRSDTFVAKVSEKLRNGCKSKTTFKPNCIYTMQTNMNNYNIPEVIELNYNFGYLIGAYAAEGCMTKHQISISNNVDTYFEPILELMKQWNITTKVYRHENKCQEGWTSQDLRIYNTILCNLLEKLCGKLSHNKFISDKIVFSNKDCILGFLDAYIGGDGHISIKQKYVSVSSVSKNLLIDIQNMLKVLNIHSFIIKYKKRESNNRGTLPENIHQLFELKIVGNQLKDLIPLLNIKLDYKQDNLQKLLNHKYKYNITKKATLIPNELNGEIILNYRNNNYNGVMFDKIKLIEEVSNTTNYAYDLTIEDTRTFNIYNGIAIFDTFHFAGVSSKSNVTRGVPRIEEILSLSSEIKNPSLSIYLKQEDERSKEKAQTIMYMIEHTKLREVVKYSEIHFDPDDLNTLINEDKECIEQFKAFENLVADCANTNLDNEEYEKSKWIIRMEMDPEIMLEKNITMDDINFTLKCCFEEQISCIYSDYNSDKLIFRIRMNEIIKSSANKGANKKTKINPLDQSDQIYILKNFQDQLLQKVVLRGINGINKVILRKILDNVVEINGMYKKQDIWVLDTIGTNLLDVLGLEFIDNTRTFSNDIIEIYDVLGIEAARQSIYNELVEVVEFDGTYINYHNYSVLVDRMTFNSKLISIFRHGINNDNIGPIAKASFEETPEMFLKAAKHAELDIMRGISANVMCGQEGYFGTSSFQVILDIEEMQKLEASSEYKFIDPDEEIEKFFGAYEDPNEKCSPNKITLQNNAINIKSFNIGNDNNYNPGF
jgi:DNA-directed RNA polymerase beta' subunit